jgi:hypothetical protein
VSSGSRSIVDARQPETFRKRHHDLTQFERDRSVGRRDAGAGLVAHDRHECLVGTAVGARPDFLSWLTREKAVDDVDGRLAKSGSDRRCEPSEVVRQALLQLGADIDRFVQLADEQRGKRRSDLLVGESSDVLTHVSLSSIWRFTQTLVAVISRTTAASTINRCTHNDRWRALVSEGCEARPARRSRAQSHSAPASSNACHATETLLRPSTAAMTFSPGPAVASTAVWRSSQRSLDSIDLRLELSG